MPTEAETKAAADKAAADKAAADKAEASKTGSVEGAQSVAEAVKRVADAAVAEVKKVQPAEPSELQFSGSAGGKFVIRGSGFGPSGTVKLNGVQLLTREWSTTHIEGDLPAGSRSGEVVVHVDEKTTRRGRVNL